MKKNKEQNRWDLNTINIPRTKNLSKLFTITNEEIEEETIKEIEENKHEKWFYQQNNTTYNE